MFFSIVWKISGKKCNFPVKTIFLKYVSVTTSNSVSAVLQKLLLKLSYLLGRHLSIQNSHNRAGFLSMSFHLLNIYLKTGRFLAITPPSTEIREHSKCRQIYQVLMIVGLVMGTLGSTYCYQEAYSDFNFVKLAATRFSRVDVVRVQLSHNCGGLEDARLEKLDKRSQGNIVSGAR
jgi:hypothetical protein